ATVGTIDAESAAPYLLPGNPPDRWIEVTHCIVPESDDARLLADIESLEVIERAGTAILLDGAREIATPYDDCVPVMPARRLARGQTAVRLGRYVPHGGVGAA